MDSRPWKKCETARRFKARRQKALMTQSVLARIIGVCRQSISEIENARVMPNPATWERFCNLEAIHNQPEIVSPAHWF
jgi:DNA-binding XRE family transcriptional regulator